MINGFFGKYRFLSNFYICKQGVEFEGIIFNNVECAFQSAKTLDRKIRLKFIKCNPKEAKAKSYKIEKRKDWTDVNLDIMYQLIYSKFSRSPYLKKKLLNTGNEELIETNTWGDTFWGVCDGIGENHLGKILMRVRKGLSDIN